MYDWCLNIPRIIFTKINTDNVQNYITKFSLEKRYSSDDSFPDSRIHCFIPRANGFKMRIISADKGAQNVSISNIQGPSNITDMPGMHIACIYDDDRFVGNIIEIFIGNDLYFHRNFCLCNNIMSLYMKKMFYSKLKNYCIQYLITTLLKLLSN